MSYDERQYLGGMKAYTPQPRQRLLHEAIADEIFYGGQAGGGKSHAVRWDALSFCINVPGCFAAIFRKTLPMLEENHIIHIREELEKLSALSGIDKIGRFNETRKKVEFQNGSILRFKHLEYDKDCFDIQGWEIHAAYVDEAAQMSPYKLGYIQSRIRLGRKSEEFAIMARKDPKLAEYIRRLPRYVLASNPGGEGHHWLKENFIDPAPPETLFEVKDEGPDGEEFKTTRIFIPATMKDNRYLDARYWIQFKNLPEWQQRQLRDGDWNVVPGAFFDCWSDDNVIRPFRIPSHWTRVWSCDWGFATPFWIGEFVVSDGTETEDLAGNPISFPEGCLILVWEWYGQEKGNKGLRLDASTVGRELKERGVPDIAVADESMWNHHDAGPSPAEKFSFAGVNFGKADRDRILGWQEMYARINDKMLLVVETCRAAVKTIPTVMSDEKKPEDVQKGGEDHAADGIRYACMSRPYKTFKPVEKKPWYQDIRPPTFDEAMRRHKVSTGPEII